MRFDDFVVYVDESGDHSLSKIHTEFPVFVLAFSVFRVDNYISEVTPCIQRLKFKYFGHDQVVLHERDIRKAIGAFDFLKNPDKRMRFLSDLSEAMSKLKYSVIACVIHKSKFEHLNKPNADPYNISMLVCLEKLYVQLKALDCKDGRLCIVFESRGKKEDKSLELAFLEACKNNSTQTTFPFDFVKAPKANNSTGLQFADLMARPIGLSIFRPQQENKAMKTIEPKIYSCSVLP